MFFFIALLLLSFNPSTFSFNLTFGDYPNRGCFWTGECLNTFLGDCGEGRAYVDMSDDCGGICPQPQYPVCPFFYSHFKCCNKEKPTFNPLCYICQSRLEIGNSLVCCSDCSAPTVTNTEDIEGYCSNGAKLSVTVKLSVNYKWAAKDWGECSSPCNGGKRKREVNCHEFLLENKRLGKTVDSQKCSSLPMIEKEEDCNVHACDGNEKEKHPHGMSVLFTPLNFIMGLLLVASLICFIVKYHYRQRQNSTNNGFVYVVLDG